jgi:alcohol dehydrogenase (cytochrome c)
MPRLATLMKYGTLAAGLAVGAVFAKAAIAQVSPSYTAQQSDLGKAVYDSKCASCHGSTLDNGEFGPPLRGDEFLSRWGGKHVDELYNYVSDRMPTTQPGSLTPDQYLNVVAYMLGRINVAAGNEKLTADAQKGMTLPIGASGTNALVTGVKLPANPNAKPNPLDTIRPVSEQMLASPPDGEWLSYSRTRDAQGYTPLKQINKGNVGQLRSVWSVTLPPGPNEATPLEHDGVLFVLSYKDVVQALDATSGNLLWQYTYRLPAGVNPGVKKSIAILDNLLYMPTSNAHMVALNIKTGAVVWDTAVADNSYGISGGPIIVKGKVIYGVGKTGVGGPKPFIVALDAKTGKEAWRFGTIPKPGEPGGDTWNGVPYDQRTGGTIWTPGSYSAEANLVFFGPAPTYDTGPLRKLVPGGNNDALYTNETLAINPDTGKLVWHFAHLPNDQWDQDWAFERVIAMIGKGSSARRIVVTSGKEGFHDIIDAGTGKYVNSIDLGFQNIIKGADPKTGAKIIDQSLIPGDGQVKHVCPGGSGGKNFTPSGYNPNTHLLFVPYAEACMDLIPVKEGERGLLTGVRMAIRPRADSDGLFGRLQAINLETGKTAWTTRERTPFMTGTLATAGGLVFAGSVDRSFSAYDDATGKRLWTTRLNDVPNSNPISYQLNGKQYVAIVVGAGGPHTSDYANLIPEVKNPSVRSSSVWVFETPKP